MKQHREKTMREKKADFTTISANCEQPQQKKNITIFK